VQEDDANLKKFTLPDFSTTKKNDHVAESLKNAANAYKAGGRYDEAGKAY
jgi:hypothetical protein